MSPDVALVIGLIATVVAVVLLYVLVLPKKMDGNLNNKFLQFLHDFFHFKKLYIESVLKFIFTVLTVFCIAYGFFFMFSQETYWGYSQSFFVPGLCLLVFGPILLRISYELMMMTILLVQNVIDINRKMGGSSKKDVNNVPVNNVPVNNVPVNNVPMNNVPVNNVPVNNGYPVNNNVPPVNNGFVAGSDMYVAPQEQPQNPQW